MAKKGIYAALGTAALLPLAGSVLLPCLAVAFLPLAAALLYAPSLQLKAGWWLFAAAALLYGLAAFAVEGAGLPLFTGTLLLLGFAVPRLSHGKLPVLWEVALGAVTATVAVCTGVCAIGAIAGRTPTDGIIAMYAQSGDPLLWRLAERAYGGFSADMLGHAHYSRYDTLYRTDVLSAYAALRVGQELSGNTLWYLTGAGVFAGGSAVTGGIALVKACHAAPDVPPVRSWRLGRPYLFAAVLPALAFALLSLYEPMRPVVRAVVNTLVMLPAALCGCTLLYHTLCRTHGKVRVLLTGLFYIALLAAGVFYEWGILVLGFLGVADMAVDVRRLLDWALN